ncbi:choline/ethanolamine kinase family protein [Stappia sp. ES.058]|uniref:choline/ethanolamine kinase family protein n=1 Tax=Stappia sp. ES.058 TaxID=1881061 RepID=UPI00087B64FE|nr:choline/ethanolamine kinase family protein [Stappia sp. ES.058]SDU32187.1 Thiamine kinase [Stappia sp. ES.058]
MSSASSPQTVSSETERRVAALPVWRGTPAMEPLSGGLSNESVLVRDASGAYVVRLGRDFPFHHVERARETMVTRAAVNLGFAPDLVYAEPGVMVTRFIDGHTFQAEDVRAHRLRIAALIRRFHREMPAEVSGAGFFFWVFHVIRDYARTLHAGGSRMADRLPEFLQAAQTMEQAQVPMPIVFGHHDLLPANFIDDGEHLWLIDFEYAGFGTAMFDLAGIASNAGLSADESVELMTAYLEHAPDAAMQRAYAAMQVASLLRETMWSLVSELHLTAPGVDYAAYTDETLAAYEAALDDYQSRFEKV